MADLSLKELLRLTVVTVPEEEVEGAAAGVQVSCTGTSFAGTNTPLTAMCGPICVLRAAFSDSRASKRRLKASACNSMRRCWKVSACCALRAALKRSVSLRIWMSCFASGVGRASETNGSFSATRPPVPGTRMKAPGALPSCLPPATGGSSSGNSSCIESCGSAAAPHWQRVSLNDRFGARSRACCRNSLNSCLGVRILSACCSLASSRAS